MSHPVYGLNELREMFLSYFEGKGHLRLPSFSLIPHNDASLLLINSGMAIINGVPNTASAPDPITAAVSSSVTTCST